MAARLIHSVMMRFRCQDDYAHYAALPTTSVSPAGSKSLFSGSKRRSPREEIQMRAALAVLLTAFGLLSWHAVVAEQRPFIVTPGAGQGRKQDIQAWTKPPRVAVIGAGPAGSSASFFLKHFALNADPGLEADVTVYESSDYIGGRSTVVWPWRDDPYEYVKDEVPVELGASIFVAANKNLQKAAQVFGLQLDENPSELGQMALFNGQQFVLTSPSSSSWTIVEWLRSGAFLSQMLWRYGTSIFTYKGIVKKTVDSFLLNYGNPYNGPFNSWAELAEATGLLQPLHETAAQYFNEGDHKLSAKLVQEIVGSATLVNYGQTPEEIHAVGALVSLAAENAVAVQGGNRRIFEEFVVRSEANLRLGKSGKVSSVTKVEGKAGGRPSWNVSADGISQKFDAVILAAPLESSGIDFSGLDAPVRSLVPPQEYVQLHVTFVMTNASAPRPEYFGLKAGTPMPITIYSTLSSPDVPPERKPKWNSLNYIRELPADVGVRLGPGVWHVVKMFSPQKMTDEHVGEIFGEDRVGKVWRKLWAAYPVLDSVPGEGKDELAKIKLDDDGLYYVNGFERVVSTMETETIASFNVVSLLLRDLFKYTVERTWAGWDEGTGSAAVRAA